MADWDNLEWDEKPSNCPECKTPLKPSQYFKERMLCPRFHGKLSTFVRDGKKVYLWYSLHLDE